MCLQCCHCALCLQKIFWSKDFSSIKLLKKQAFECSTEGLQFRWKLFSFWWQPLMVVYYLRKHLETWSLGFLLNWFTGISDIMDLYRSWFCVNVDSLLFSAHSSWVFSFGLEWFPLTRISTLMSYVPPTRSMPVESWNVICQICLWLAVWATVWGWWSHVQSMPLRAEGFLRPSMRLNPSALPCTPPVSSGWPLFPFFSAHHNPQKR